MTSSAASAVIDTDRALRTAIEAGLAESGVAPDGGQIEQFTRYLRLLEKWNQVYNLSGVRDVYKMIAAHLLDSLSVRAFIKGPRVLDVGSGAGLPGIPLALARPHLQFVLLDSNAKKIRFIRQAVIELRLTNVRAACKRAETYRSEAGFDTVISRAFASLADFVARADPVCAPAGRMLAMKSSLSMEEQGLLSSMPERFKTYKLKTFKLRVPHIDSKRQLIEIRKA